MQVFAAPVHVEPLGKETLLLWKSIVKRSA
jgi:hypothetical protein